MLTKTQLVNKEFARLKNIFEGRAKNEVEGGLNGLDADLTAAVSLLYRIEYLNSAGDVDLDEVTGEENWLTSRLKEVTPLIMSFLVYQLDQGVKKPKFIAASHYTTELFSFREFTATGILVLREFRSPYDSYTREEVYSAARAVRVSEPKRSCQQYMN